MEIERRTTASTPPEFRMGAEDRHRLEGLPWHVPLEEWPEHGVIPLSIRRGESRHPVIFVEREGWRYAIKETSPHMAEREIASLHAIERRGIPALSPIGTVTVANPPILLDVQGPGGLPQYISGDRGYTVTRLAQRDIPQALLYRIPFTRRTKQRLLGAIAVLLIELHEHGIYWGDPSLANILMRIDGRRIMAILADAETAELFPGPVSDGLREQDRASFGESLTWQAEDIRWARGLSAEEELVNDADFRYFEQKYRLLRREHAQLALAPSFTAFYQVQRFLEGLNQLGVSLLGIGGRAMQEFITVLPGWYARRIHDLLGITIPRAYAHRFYNMILGHQILMHQHEGRDISLEEVARDWYTRYHLPTVLLLRQHLTNEQDPMRAYFGIMQKKWQLSQEAGYEVSMDEAVFAWAMEEANTGELGAVDPATLATWWREREPVTQVLEPPPIASAKLEPLLSSQEEKRLVSLSHPELEQELTGIWSNKNRM